MKLFRTLLSRFTLSRRGNVALIVAIVAPVLVTAGGVSVDLLSQLNFKKQVLAASDAAALAATAAMQSGQSQAAAQQIGQNAFNANAPSGAPSDGSVSIQTGNYASTLTALVRYQGSVPTYFSGLVGMSTMPFNVTSKAQAGTGTSNGVNSYAGIGTMWGDPYIEGADGVFHDMMCTSAPPGSWYNALSDSGIEVNIQCSPLAGMPAYQVISGFSIILNGHTIYYTAPQPSLQNGQWVYPSIWWGQVTIDGVYYPAKAGNWSYLGGAVVANISEVNGFGSLYLGDNHVVITTPRYTISTTFSYQTLAAGQITITANGAGACGVPGGILGGLLAGSYDSITSDYLVSTPTTTTYQYRWKQCSASASTMTPTLVQ